MARVIDAEKGRREAQRLLSPHCYRGTEHHDRQWELDRARWQYQYGSRRIALEMLREINSFRNYLKWEGRPNNEELAESVLAEKIGSMRALGKRDKPPWTKHGYVLSTLERGLRYLETGAVDVDALPANLRKLLRRVVKKMDV